MIPKYNGKGASVNRFFKLLALIGLVAIEASAGQVEKKDSWILSELAAGDSTVCEAATTDSGIIRDYTLKIQKVKNSKMPVEVFLYEKGKAEYGAIATATVGNEVLLFNQFSIEAKSSTFWYLPDETKQLIDLLKSTEQSVKVKPFGDLKGRDLKFSLKGAAHILAAMEKRCNDGKALTDARMSALTNHPAAFDQAPRAFDAAMIAELRAVYFELAAHHEQLLAQEAALAKLTQANLPNITERDNLRAERINLVNNKIPALKQDIQATTARIAAAESRILQLKTEIPAAEKQKAAAQARYDEAYKKIAPHLPKHDQLVSQLSNAQEELSDALDELSSAESEIASNERKIQQLDAQAQQLNYKIQQLRSDIPYAQAATDRAWRDYNSFNADYEIKRRLDQSSRYRTLKMEAHNLHDQINGEREVLRSLERELQRAKAQLAQCQTDMNNTCEPQKAQVAEAERQVSAKEREVSNLESQLNSTRREMESIENDIEREVRRIQDQLRREYDEAASKLSNLHSQLERAEGERRDIVEYQIPRLRNRNQELRIRAAQLEREIVSLRQEVKNATAELNQFDNSVGFEKLEQALNAAEDQLDAAKTQLNRLVAEDTRLKAALAEDKSRLTNLNEALRSSEARLVAVGQRLVQLDKELAAFDSGKSLIEERMAVIRNQIKDAQYRYVKHF